MTHLIVNAMRRSVLIVIGIVAAFIAFNVVGMLLKTAYPTFAQDADIVPLGQEAEYFITADYVITNTQRMPAAAPSSVLQRGQRWIVVVLSFGNGSGERVRVDRNTLALLDSDGNRMRALPVQEQSLHRVFNIWLEPGDHIRGAVRFRVPTGVEPVSVEWCPETCDEAIVVPLP